MPARRTTSTARTLAALCTLCALASAGQGSKPQASKPQVVGIAGSSAAGPPGGPCSGRGLPAPCVVTCSVSLRFCKACCAALAALGPEAPFAPPGAQSNATEAPSASSPPADRLLWEMALNNATSCLAPCVKFTAKEVRKVLEKPEENMAVLGDMAEQLGQVNKAVNWTKALQGPRLFSLCVDLNCL